MRHLLKVTLIVSCLAMAALTQDGSNLNTGNVNTQNTQAGSIPTEPKQTGTSPVFYLLIQGSSST